MRNPYAKGVKQMLGLHLKESHHVILDVQCPRRSSRRGTYSQGALRDPGLMNLTPLA